MVQSVESMGNPIYIREDERVATDMGSVDQEEAAKVEAVEIAQVGSQQGANANADIVWGWRRLQGALFILWRASRPRGPRPELLRGSPRYA